MVLLRILRRSFFELRAEPDDLRERANGLRARWVDVWTDAVDLRPP